MQDFPISFNASRRTPIRVGNDTRYDICQATECVSNENCTRTRTKNNILMDDTGIHINQTSSSKLDEIDAECSFEPFSFVDNNESPFIYVQAWFKYEPGPTTSNSTWRANAHDLEWWCPPDVRERLEKAATFTQIRRRLTF